MFYLRDSHYSPGLSHRSHLEATWEERNPVHHGRKEEAVTRQIVIECTNDEARFL